MGKRYTLSDYQRDSGCTTYALAERLGVSQAYAWQLLHGRRTPTLAMALNIVSVTGIDIETLLPTNGRKAAR